MVQSRQITKFNHIYEFTYEMRNTKTGDLLYKKLVELCYEDGLRDLRRKEKELRTKILQQKRHHIQQHIKKISKIQTKVLLQGGKLPQKRQKRRTETRDDYLVSDNNLSTDYYNASGIICFYCGDPFEEFEEQLQCCKCKRYAHTTCAQMSRSAFNNE